MVVVVGEGGGETDELVGTRAAERDGNCTTKKICQTGGKYIEKREREMWKIKCCKGRTCHWLSEYACVSVCESAYSATLRCSRRCC